MKFKYRNANHDEKEFEIVSDQLAPCPGCGHIPTEYDIEDEFIYPLNRERTLWTANCTQYGTGCGWSVMAGSPEEALALWNRRVYTKYLVPHQCQRSTTCSCNIQDMEPNEKCPIHGYGEFPPRCEICGKFVKWSQ